MERFEYQITDEGFKSKLEAILQQNKPFRNFKNVIDDSNFRQEWFDFKQSELEKRLENN